MEWQDQGILLTRRPHGEGSAIIEVFSEHHGKHAGLVRGGSSRKSAPLLQPGNLLALKWRARIEDHLGTFSVELKATHAGMLIKSRNLLYAFNALSSMLVRYFPEREPYMQIFRSLHELIICMCAGDQWQYKYCLLELKMLETLGYGLDLSECVVTGQPDDLTHVSPKSGRAVSRGAATGWEAKLLPFPQFLREKSLASVSREEFRQFLALTGYFFEHHAGTSTDTLPEARRRFAEIV